MSKRKYFLISFVLVLSLAGNILAYETIIWDNNTGMGDQLWQTATNWRIDKGGPEVRRVPIIDDYVVIDDYADDSNGPIINEDTNAVAQWVDMGGLKSPAGGEAVLTMTGGSLTATGWFSVGAYYAGTYRFEMTGGNLEIDGGGADEGIWVGYYPIIYATLDINDGSILCSEADLYVGGAETSMGILNMTGGNINLEGTDSNGWFCIGSWDTRPGNGHANLHGGTLETRLLSMGGGGVGSLDFTEGTLIIDGDYRGPNGWLFDPLVDTATDEVPAGYTGTIAILANRGLLTAYNTPIGDIITDPNYPAKAGLRAVIKMDYNVTNSGQTTLTGDAVAPELAWNPTPLNGSAGFSKGEVDLISWSAGDNAESHDVYFGTNFTEVNEATTPLATQSETTYPVTTTWGTDYFWRIDEFDGATTWKGNVWSFSTRPAWATDPSPEDGAGGVSVLAAVLSWTPGPEADTHHVYFSTDFSDVNDRDLSVRTIVSDPRYIPGALERNTLYYWAVDEVNNLEDVNVWPSLIWDFRTADHLVVDNFNSYADIGTLEEVWDDYSGNGSRSDISLETDIAYDGNSMGVAYSNIFKIIGNVYGSWVDADTVDLPVGTDWTYGGAKALKIAFYGNQANSTTVNDKLYIALDDGVTVHSSYYPDVNDINEESWHEWHIDLEDFNSQGVDLTNVSRITIGFGAYGGTVSAGGTGTVYFDNIELWPPYCRTEMVPADVDGDCVTNSFDLQVMASDWLKCDYDVTAVPISGAPVGWWKFDEGMGTSTDDSSAYNNDGDVIDASWTTGYPNDPYDSALHFEGDGEAEFDRVICAERTGSEPGNYPAELMPSIFTVACWVKCDSFDYFETFVTDGMDDGGDESGFFLYSSGVGGPGNFGLGIRTEDGMNYVETDSFYLTNTWYHLAATYDDANTVRIYVDGMLAGDPENVGGPIKWISNYSSSYPDQFLIGALPEGELSDWYYADATIDDVRVYDYPLPHGEIVTLAEQGPTLYNELISPANIYDLEAKLSKKVNFADYAIMADHWLEGPTLWP